MHLEMPVGDFHGVGLLRRPTLFPSQIPFRSLSDQIDYDNVSRLSCNASYDLIWQRSNANSYERRYESHLQALERLRQQLEIAV